MVESDDPRQKLAEEQAQLVRALVAGEAPPGEFDPERVRLARDSLVRKRRREIVKVVPWLASVLGSELEPLVEEYVRTHALAAGDEYRTDAMHLLSFLARHPRVRRQQRIAILRRMIRARRPLAVFRLILELLGRTFTGSQRTIDPAAVGERSSGG